MILQALNQYYERLSKDESATIPLFGFSEEKISFVLVVSPQGKLLQTRDIRRQIKNKLVPQLMNVPEAVIRTSGKKSNFIWDKTQYILGAGIENNKDELQKCFGIFQKLQCEIGNEIDDEGMMAVLKFLDHWAPNNAYKIPNWEEVAGKNLIFQLDGQRQYIHERPKIRQAWLKFHNRNRSSVIGTCLVTGERRSIAQLHSPLGGFADQVRLVSFNKDSFISYGKEQNVNAPVGEEPAFNYATSLNYLLNFDSRQKIQIADSTVVFWAERRSPMEGFLGRIVDSKDDSGETPEIKHFLEAVREGKKPKNLDGANKFYILGLSPNVSRLAVRFWFVSTVDDIALKIGQHFQDLSVIKSFDSDKEFPGIWWLLKETVRDSKDIPPLLVGAMMRSILTGAAYPQTLLSSVIGRIRADGNVNYYRAAIIKACLVRKYRIMNQPMEVGMTLNKDSTSAAYRLGRLFAVLEKAQKDAIPAANATIKDRFYGSASATPKVVFPLLLRLAQHHIQKSNFRISLEKDIQEIVSGVKEFPAHLSLDEQGLFALGYYHQKKDIYTKSEKKEEASHV
ncbi:MAG: type I-C CRISPR-associated protein Cas8c/Csd1 [Candidatus Omnitrophica bacterium]|nr:type I-C CRISPR-associated protein Cas8c/Csd1 [Candidatus Omnitrophota bacterium]